MDRFALTRRNALVAVALALGAVLLLSRVLAAGGGGVAGGVGAGAAGAGAGTGQVVSPPFPSPVEATETASEVVVDVTGAVRRPGVYRLRPGTRVADAIARAGGPTRRAEPSLLNLAAPLVDGQQVVMPRRGGAQAATRQVGTSAPPAPVSLSLADAEELDALPGIGPVTAEKIVAYRREHGPFTSVDQLDAISGIGPKRLESLRELVVP
jgi:competence protein ComEA